METPASSGEPGSSELSGNPVVILNPTANRGNMQHYRALIRSRLEQEHGGGEYVETTRRGEAKERAYPRR